MRWSFKKTIVQANHFLVEIADKDLHCHNVSISFEVTSKKISRGIIKQLVKLYKVHFPSCRRSLSSSLDKREPRRRASSKWRSNSLPRLTFIIFYSS
jgi:hypothetical protein